MTEPAIDTGEILEALNDKVDRDCRNVDTTSGADAVIEWQAPTAANNYTWYRLYKNGWIEQGGVISSIASGSSKTGTLPVAMSNTNYTLVVTSNGAYVAQAEANNSAVRTSTTVITISNGSHNACDFSWEVKGMVAQS